MAISTPPIPAITINAPGKAEERTFGKNLPVTLSEFGSSARIKDGTPMVTIPISVSCCGAKGSSLGINININASKKLYMVLTRKSEALRSRLFIDRLPSATTLGMEAKLLSKSTKLLTFLAASDPDAIAMEQSASFNASTSFTPSPVIATVCPFALSAFISASF